MTKKSQCQTCRHFIDNGDWGCKAFPIIPDYIFFNNVMHEKIVEGQIGNFIYDPIQEDIQITEVSKTAF